MSGRRNNLRYLLSVPREGTLVVAHDIIVENRTDEELLVSSDEPYPRGQQLTIELGAGVAVDGIQARVLECEPMVVDGSLRYRLRVAIGAGIARDGSV
jgi:hypothetical protein